MKKILVALALVLFSQISMAQDFKSDVLKLIKVSGGTAQFESAKKQISGMIPQDKQAEFSKEFDASLPALYDKIAEVYMQEYTAQDVKDILKFYDTPVGKKMSEKSSVMIEKSMAAAQEWGMGLQGIMMKYMQEQGGE